MDSTACYGDRFSPLYVGNIRPSQVTSIGFHGVLWGCYYFLNVDDVRTS
jgi:hypothetical protein